MKELNKISRITLFIGVISIFLSCDSADQNKNLDNMPLVDGKRTFIIGSYHLPKSKEPYKTLAKNGYNYVLANHDSTTLDKVLKHNLKAWINTGIVDEKDTIAGKKRLTDLLMKYKNHPALLYWEIADEPAFTWNSAEARISPAKMREAYNIIRESDKNHPVITNHGPVNLISTLKKYNTSTDIVAVDVYPVIPHGIKPSYALYKDGLQGDLLNPYLSQVGEYIDKMKKVVDYSKPVFAVLQGFAWEMLVPEKDRDSSMILYPTFEQSRFMAYNAIVHGADGILIWGTNYTPQPSKFMDDLNKVTRELAEMQDVLSSTSAPNNITLEYHELGYSLDAGIEFIMKKVNNKTYLLTVNSDKKPVKVTFKGLDKFQSVQILNENKTIEIIKGKFTNKYMPFGVVIYQLN